MQKHSGSSVIRAGSRGRLQGTKSKVDMQRVKKLLFEGMFDKRIARPNHDERVESMIDRRCEYVTQWDTHPREGTVWLHRLKHSDYFLVHTQETWQIGPDVVRQMMADDRSIDFPLREQRNRFEVISRREAVRRFLR